MKNSKYVLVLFLSLFITFFVVGNKIPKAKAAPCTITVSNTNNSGSGSLRQAITDANVASDVDTICFNIGSGLQTIIPTSPLVAITKPAILDATTQPGFSGSPLIEIKGTGSGDGAVGFWITAGNTTVKGFIINDYSANGIFITNNSGNTIINNYIGTNSGGTSAVPNGTDGVGIYNSSGHTIGGATSAERNVISGNAGNGIGITDDEGAGSAESNVIIGNYIGTNYAGTGAVPNEGDGVLINNAANNNVGGTTGVTVDGACSGECNLISGNSVNGVGVWFAGATGNTIMGNFIGTSVSGDTALANGDIGVEVNEAPNNVVGGTASTFRNIVSGNLGAGLLLTGAGATGNSVKGNYIGTNTDGTFAIPNVKMGVSIGYSPEILSANGNAIGGTTGITLGGACTGDCNLISGNTQNGVFITSNSGVSGNQVHGNYIGTNAAGTGAIPNAIDAVGILDAPNNIIGGSTESDRNVISGNSDKGIIITGSGSTGNRVSYNYIGLATNGSNLGNSSFGVLIDTNVVDTAILANSIFANGDMGIDLGYNRVSLNDQGDGDIGANRMQNFPLATGNTVGGATRIYGTLNSMPSTSFRLEFFSSVACNAGPTRNFGEGQVYLGGTSVSTDIFGNVSYSFSPASAVDGGRFITATATKEIGGIPAETSEFSECTQVNAEKPAVASGSTWYLRNVLVPDDADTAFGYGFPATRLMCAWDSNQPGRKLPIVFSNGSWFMRGSHTTGVADNSFSYGSSSVRPVCGDWDGDGIESIGAVYDNLTWDLRNTNNSGPPDISFQYGAFGSIPVTGDWDGDGDDTIGVVVNGSGWSLRNENSSGPEQVAFAYGFPSIPLPGDWNGDGTDTPGLVVGNTWLLRNDNSPGAAQISFNYGFPGAIPIQWR